MFIREYKTRNKATATVYIKHQLVESYRSQAGPRQRIIMNLGKVNLPKSEWRRLAFALEDSLSGQKSLIDDPNISAAVTEIMKNYDFYRVRKSKEEKEGNFLTVDLEKIATTACRSLGPEIAAHFMWDKLSMDTILSSCQISKENRELAKAAILARLISPASEADTLLWIKHRSAAAELININLLDVKKDSLYNISDTLLYHKEAT
jgi:hypothetical protein